MRALLLFFLVACQDPVKIPVDYRPNDVAIVAYEKDGRLAVEVTPHLGGLPIELEADDDAPIYTWVLRQEDFVQPTGEPIPIATLQAVLPRLDGSVGGGCARCLAPSDKSPQVINEGDSCRLPPFTRGAIWQPSESGFICSGASESAICSTGPDADQKLIEEVRRAIFLDWPGACACSGVEDVPSLAEIEVRAISPVAAPNPIEAYAQDQEGRIAGFNHDVVVLWDPVAGATTVTPIENWPVAVTHAIALADGTGFLVASEEFNTGYFDTWRFDRFTVSNGELIGPETVADNHIARVSQTRYLGDDPDLPFYLVGGVRGNVGNFEPALFACTDRTLACQQVSLESCPDERNLTRAYDVELMPNGAAVLLANQALYLKDPNPAPMSNPNPSDTWRCHQNTSRLWPIRGGGTVKTREYVSVGKAGNRAFVCATSETAACTPDYAVVLSATITASAGAVLEPEWEMLYRGYDWSRCRDFMRVPNEPSQVRARISGQVLIDFDENGTILKETDIGTEYAAVDGLTWIEDMALDDHTLLETNESQAFLKVTGQELTQIYGGPDRALASYRSGVALGEGDWLMFGHPDGLVRVRVLSSGGDFPETSIEVLSDPTGAIMEGDDLRDAVIDSKESAAAGMPVVMIVGERDSDALLMRATISETELVRATVLPPPAAVDNLGAVRVGEAAPGQFVIGLEGTRLLRAVGDSLTELEIDFDDPDTDAAEARPILEPDFCSGNTPRLDAWRDIEGKNGVAWVIGSHQMVFRVTGDRVERFYGSPTAEYSALHLTCADRAVFAGRGTSVDLAGIERVTTQFWSIDPVEHEANEEISLEVGREQALREIASDQVTAIGIGYLQEGYPRAVVPDTTGGRGDPDHAPFAAILHNGYMARFFAAEGLISERPPFYPEVVIPSPGGYVLYGGWDSRLALGVPAAKR